jgi:choline kinase
MAAGTGSRIGKSFDNKPKCLIPAGSETLVTRMVKILRSRKIDDITIVTGYKSQQIHDELGSTVNYFYNPFYAASNSIASLWLARELLNDDVLLLNADLFFEEAVIDVALNQTGPAVMLSDYTTIEDADFCFKVDGERILKAGNQLNTGDIDCEYVGIARIDKNFVPEFRQRLEDMIRDGDFNNWWEGVLYSFFDQRTDITHIDVDGAFWTEIDHMGDYRRLQNWLTRNDTEYQTSKTGDSKILEPEI